MDSVLEQAKQAILRSWTLLRSQGPSQIQFWFIALSIGIVAGLAAVGFRLAISGLQGAIYGTDDIAMLHSWARTLPWYVILVTPILGGIAVGLILDRFTDDGRVRSVADVIEGAALNDYTAEPVQTIGPLPIPEALDELGGRVPRPSLTRRGDVLAAIEEVPVTPTEVVWLADGVIGRTGADRAFLNYIGDAPRPSIFRAPLADVPAIVDVTSGGAGLTVTVERLGGAPYEASISALNARGERVLSVPLLIAQGDRRGTATLDLPLTIRNTITAVAIDGMATAGATWLMDAGSRRIRAGLVTDGATTLLDGGFYLRQALAPFADVTIGDAETLAQEETGLIILDDVGALRPTTEQSLLNWVDGGGVLLRFAGPNLASAPRQRADTPGTLPLPLRRGERAFGGALTWEQPQTLAPFDSDSPLADLPLPEDVEIRRQVLSRSDTPIEHQVWARLEDGTPLITARQRGRGLLILVHVTATPTWSDLPLTGLFADLMGRIAAQAAGAPLEVPSDGLQPWQHLNGFGRLTTPPPTANPLVTEETQLTDDLLPPVPGLYGTPDRSVAVNTRVDGEGPTLDLLTVSALPANATLLGLQTARTLRFGPWLVAAAFVLFAIDALVLWWMRRSAKVPGPSAAAGASAAFILFISMGMGGLLLSASPAAAQFTPPPVEPQAAAAALDVRLAYVQTDDASLDRVVRAGLSGVTREATRRTALEPAPPMGIDLERDDLTVFPLIYWAVTADTPIPSDNALFSLERFMDTGGLLIIDTMDGERLMTSGSSPASDRLREILTRMDVPPLDRLGGNHIFLKSFYWLDDLHGRNSSGPVWVEASAALREETDAVPSLLISGRDWASAWALDDDGIPLRPVGDGFGRREMAFRAGINMAMVALTGNYKTDQVHVQDLLDSLGEEE